MNVRHRSLWCVFPVALVALLVVPPSASDELQVRLIPGVTPSSIPPLQGGYVPIVVKPADVQAEEPPEDRLEEDDSEESAGQWPPGPKRLWLHGKVERAAAVDQVRVYLQAFRVVGPGVQIPASGRIMRTIQAGAAHADYSLEVLIPPKSTEIDTYVVVAETGAGVDRFLTSGQSFVRRLPGPSAAPEKLRDFDRTQFEEWQVASPGHSGYVPIVVKPSKDEVRALPRGTITLEGAVERYQETTDKTVRLRVFHVRHAGAGLPFNPVRIQGGSGPGSFFVDVPFGRDPLVALFTLEAFLPSQGRPGRYMVLAQMDGSYAVVGYLAR